MWYHALNRGNGRQEVFHKEEDYAAFVQAMADARVRLPVDVLGYCLMPNHFHLVLRPGADGELGRWMQWLPTAHARRSHRHYGTSGHVWQGRFKAFPIQSRRVRQACADALILRPRRAAGDGWYRGASART
jgi:putative transposase